MIRHIPLTAVLLASILLAASGCKKDATEPPAQAAVTAGDVLSDFAATVAIPNYTEIAARAAALERAAQLFDTAATDLHLSSARDAWRSTRESWEQCEGFLFGPVEDFNYDPSMDTWPVNRTDLDSLLASTNPLGVSDVAALPTSLKGFHPIEYLLFGEGGTRRAAELGPREKAYLISLCADLRATTTALRESWNPSVSGNFTAELLAAGSGTGRYAKKKDALIAIASAMAGICDEVGGGKMAEPLLAQDSTLEESQFSHNSTADFRNNIIGIRNAYFGKYLSDRHGLNELVAARNASLDNTITVRLNAAIDAFSTIDSHYGRAIYTQQAQIHAVQDALDGLKTVLETDLTAFINANVSE